MTAMDLRPLSRGMAQRIVDQVATTLEQNLNLMDTQGVIVASRDESRLGTVHPGARRVARTGEPVVIHPGEEPPGTRAGINLPLTSGDRILGVVGVTGDPREIGPIAQVVQLATQLLVEQAAAQDASERRETADRDLIATLLAPDGDVASIRHRLEETAHDVPGPWLIAVFLREPGGRPWPPRPDVIRGAPRHHLRWTALHDALWALGSATARTMDHLLAMAGEIGAQGIVTAGTEDLHTLRAHGHALAAIAARRTLITVAPGTLRTLEDMPVELAAAHLPLDQCRVLAARVRGLGRGHRELIEALLTTGGSIVASAGILHTHRNTVVQRLARIRHLTGLDPRDSRHLLTLTLGLRAERVVETSR